MGVIGQIMGRLSLSDGAEEGRRSLTNVFTVENVHDNVCTIWGV
jgi:hypothetical protein